ncbi:MAG: hypothetical protein GX887_00065 [Firmicutes bacterium]|nr:hypothetical protein [Bacillota bacterium]
MSITTLISLSGIVENLADENQMEKINNECCYAMAIFHNRIAIASVLPAGLTPAERMELARPGNKYQSSDSGLYSWQHFFWSKHNFPVILIDRALPGLTVFPLNNPLRFCISPGPLLKYKKAFKKLAK